MTPSLRESLPPSVPEKATSTRIVRGLAQLSAWRDDLERVADECSVVITGAPDWLFTWAETHLEWRPLGVFRTDDEGHLRAAVLLAERWRGPLREVVALGHGPSDYARFLGPPMEADGLADAVGTFLAGRRCPWLLRLEQFPQGDPFLRRLASRIPAAALRPGVASPMVGLLGFDPNRDVRKSARQSSRTGRNRAASDGVAITVERTRNSERVRELLPGLERLHIARDRAIGRRSDLEDPKHLRFWRRLLPEAASRGQVEVVILRLDEQPACQMIAFLDGDVYRVWDFRIAPGTERYNPGHILRDDVLHSLVADGRWSALDWMRGEESYKRASANTVEPAESLRAWSSPLLRRTEFSVRRARALARAVVLVPHGFHELRRPCLRWAKTAAGRWFRESAPQLTAEHPWSAGGLRRRAGPAPESARRALISGDHGMGQRLASCWLPLPRPPAAPGSRRHR